MSNIDHAHHQWKVYSTGQPELPLVVVFILENDILQSLI